MATIKFTKEHEWVAVDGDVATVGITAHAAEQLGDVVFVETPDVGRKVTAGEACAVVESVKAASDIRACHGRGDRGERRPRGAPGRRQRSARGHRLVLQAAPRQCR